MDFCRYKRAARALEKGDESLAKEALKRRKAFAVRHFTAERDSLVLVTTSVDIFANLEYIAG